MVLTEPVGTPGAVPCCGVGVEAGEWEWRLGSGRGGWGVGVEAGEWAWRPGSGGGGWGVGVEAEECGWRLESGGGGCMEHP